MSTSQIILENIKKKILENKSKGELAKIIGIKEQSITTLLNNLEKGGSVTIRTLENLAAAAGLESYKELL